MQAIAVYSAPAVRYVYGKAEGTARTKPLVGYLAAKHDPWERGVDGDEGRGETL